MHSLQLSCLISLILTGSPPDLTEDYDGVVEAIPTRHQIVCPWNGDPVTAIHKKVGDRVEKGDLLVELDPAPLPKLVAEARLKSIQAQRDSLLCQLEYWNQEQLRAQRLYDQQAGTLRALQASQERQAYFNAELAKNIHDIELAKVQLAMAKYTLNHYANIHALIDGVVVQVNTAYGEVARPQDQQIILMRIVDPSVVYVKFPVPIDRARTINIFLTDQQPVSATVRQGTKIELRGKVINVSLLSDDGESVPVTLLIPNPNEELIIGAKVKVEI